MSSISIGSSLALTARRLGAPGLLRPEMAWRGCVEDDVHERLPPCHRLDAVAPPSLSRRLGQYDHIVNMKDARELGARHVSPATDCRGQLRFLVSASCRFAGMAAPRRFLYDEAAATLHRILAIKRQPTGAPPPEGRPDTRARACSRTFRPQTSQWISQWRP